MLPRIDKESDDRLFAKSLSSLQSVQTLYEYEAGAIRPYLDRRRPELAVRALAASCRGLSKKRQRQLDFGFCVGCLFSQSFIRARACNSASSRDPNTTLPFISTPAGYIATYHCSRSIRARRVYRMPLYSTAWSLDTNRKLRKASTKWPVLKTVVAGFEPDLFSAWSCR